ncbi:leucine-rich repeat protein [Flammeovirga agarivorans]|uniref:Leucine-rich repeat protein n=1 Tax=Flammeovirga agarivorans TaxID=2726742 RepID=A0A7X8SQ47_9BACT|nr:leucine-rich repeat protein [Flammeovirga agarivorans]NLR94344.1 leucine-rich repeat protein [Flammeovirga agarivorans]
MYTKLIATIAVSLLTCNLFAQTDYTLNDDDVIVYNGYIQLCSYSFENPNIIIPSTLDGQEVIGIESYNTPAQGVFYNKGIQKVTLPTSLKDIGNYAFMQNQLSGIQLPESVEKIGIGAFRDNQLEEISLEDHITAIGTSSFNNNSISIVTLGYSTIDVGDSVFAKNEIETLEIQEKVRVISTHMFAENQISVVQLPTTIQYLKQGAFSNNEHAFIILPENSDPAYSHWLSSATEEIDAGYKIIDFDKGYTAILKYTLQDQDVTVEQGNITSVQYDEKYNDITIPSQLDGQDIIELQGAESSKNGLFYKKNIHYLQFSSTLKKIGDYSFYNNCIHQLSLANGIEEVGKSAFYENQLQQLDLGEIKTIGKHSFSNNQLKSISIPGSLKVIGYGSFSRNSMEQLTIQEGVEAILESAFNSNKLKQISIPSSVKRIDDLAFIHNDIESVTFNEGLESLHYEAFAYNNIREVQLPSTLDTLVNDAFEGNYIKEITLPQPDNLEDFLYWDDPAGDEFNAPGDVISTTGESRYTQYYKSILDDFFIVRDGVITGTNFYLSEIKTYHIKLPSVIRGQTIIGIGKDGLRHKNIRAIKLPETLEFIDEYGLGFNYIKKIEIPKNIKRVGKGFLKGNRISDLSIKTNSLTEIPSEAFYGNQLTQLHLPSTVKSIQSDAYKGNNLVEIDLSNIDELGEDAFSYNDLTTVTLSDQLEVIPTKCFEGNNLTTVNFGKNITEIGYYAFEDNALQNVNLPSSIRYINHSAFRGNELTSIKLPAISEEDFMNWHHGNEEALKDNILRLDDYGSHQEVFAAYIYTLKESDVQLNNNQLVRITSDLKDKLYIKFPFKIGNKSIYQIESNDNRSIMNGAKPYKIIIEEGITKIGKYAFEYANTYEVELPSSLITIDNNAFKHSKLTTLVIPESVKTIGNNAFEYGDITSITIPKSISEIGSYAFENNEISAIHFPKENAQLKTLGYHAFHRNQINQLELPSSLEYIGVGCFTENNISTFKLPNIQKDGFVEWYSSGQFYANNAVVNNEDVSFEALFLDTLSGNDATLEDGIITHVSSYSNSNFWHLYIPKQLNNRNVIGIGSDVLDKAGIRTLILEEGIISIGDNAFKDNYINTLELPQSLLSIGAGAFQNSGLKDLQLPNNIQLIEAGAFYGNKELTSFKLPMSKDSDFDYWLSGDNVKYNNGEEVNNFFVSYLAVYKGDRPQGKPEKPTDLPDVEQPQLSVFPNPTNNAVYIRNLEQEAKGRVLNVEGKVVDEITITPVNNKIDLNYKKGVYIIELILDQNIEVFKVIKN